MKAVYMVVYGFVQGVGFRYFTLKTAQKYGVYGWVRNTSEGHVEIHAEGESCALEQFVLSVHRGPAGALVDRVQTNDVMVNGCQKFDIKY